MKPLKSLERNDVFILGAGFSKAASEQVDDSAKAFPLAAELLDPIVSKLGDRLSDAAKPRGGEGFEQWLSRLAEDQPHLSADQNLERSIAFLLVSQKIGEILTERENFVLKNEMPTWFAKLLFAWHVRHATVISFNYDNLIECGVESQHLPMFDQYPVRTHDILNRLPPLPPSRQIEETRISNIQGGGLVSMDGKDFEQATPWQETFRLIKLHGSISWYWVPDDATGATLQRWPDVGSFGQPAGDQSAEIRRQLPGREPFIAPPSSTKSRYLANPVIRQLWRDALDTLREADRIFFLGYSIPAQDQAVMSLIIEGIGDRTPQIQIVDIDADSVRDNLANLLVNYKSLPGESKEEILKKKLSKLKRCYRLKSHSTVNVIKDAADGYFDELSEEAARNLAGVARSLNPIKVEDLIKPWNGPDDGATYPITGDVLAPSLPIRIAGPWLDCGSAIMEGNTLKIPVITSGDIDARQLTKLMRHLQEDAGIKKIVASYKDGTEIPVIPFALVTMKTDHLTGDNWHSLHLTPFITQTPSAR